MQHLVADPNSRVRLIAASSLLVAEPGNALAGAVLAASLEDPVLRVREAALELLERSRPDGVLALQRDEASETCGDGTPPVGLANGEVGSQMCL